MLHFYLWIYFLVFIFLKFSISALNEAPAKVTLRLQLSKLNHAAMNDSILKVCIDKRNESCFWTSKKELLWDGDQYNEIVVDFFLENIATDLTLTVTVEEKGNEIKYEKKSINLLNTSSKEYFELRSFNLESFVTLNVKYECENDYYPPRQCSKRCISIPNESECDGFGNKKCKEGLLYNAQLDKCIPNNCVNLKISCHNGQCINFGLTYKCICLQSYFGKFCELRNPCYPNPCSNGGICNIETHKVSFKCSCPEQFSGTKCQFENKDACLCPKNTKCVISPNGDSSSCIPDQPKNDQDNNYIPPVETINNENFKSKSLEAKKNLEWKPISLTTTIIAAVACLMLILCICVSLYVFYYTRGNQKNKRDNTAINSPSTLYTDFTQNSKETSFKRSLSLDDNSAYMPANSHMLQILPNTFTMGSSTGYSLHTNSYQDNPSSSLRNLPLYGGYMYQPEYPVTPLIFHQNFNKESSASTTSGGSLNSPPILPPRIINTEITSTGTLPKNE